MRKRRREGFTLIEVAAAVAILAFVMSAVLQVRNRTVRIMAASRSQMLAADLAVRKLEELRAGNEGSKTGRFKDHPEYGWVVAEREVNVHDTPVRQYEVVIGSEQPGGITAVRCTLLLPRVREER